MPVYRQYSVIILLFQHSEGYMFDKTRTEARDDEIELANKLRLKQTQPVHPDVMVDPRCPDSIKLLEKQRERAKTKDGGKVQS